MHPAALDNVKFISSSQAVKEEGQDPDEIGITLEATNKKIAKRCVKGTHLYLLLLGA